MQKVIPFPTVTPKLGDMIRVRFPSLNKNNTLEENDERSLERSNTERCKVRKIVTLSPEEFEEVSNSLMEDRPEIWEHIGGSESDAPEFEGLRGFQILQNPKLTHVFHKTSWVNVVLVKTTDDSKLPFVVNTEGYSYARYAGRIV